MNVQGGEGVSWLTQDLSCIIPGISVDEGGWFQGKVTWYNTKMVKLRIYYGKGSKVTKFSIIYGAF